jgi:G3E family GTPase
MFHSVLYATFCIAFRILICMQTFFNEQSVSQNFRLDAVVTVVDTKHLLQHLDEKRHEGEENESQYVLLIAEKYLILTYIPG